MCITLPHPSDTRTVSSPCRSAMPGSKPPFDSRPPMSRSPRRAAGSHFRGAPSIWVPSIRAAPDRSARGVGRGDPLGVCPVSSLSCRASSRRTLITLRALRRGSPVNVAGCHEGEESSCCIHPPGASRCPLLGWTSRGDIGEGLSCRSDTEDLGAGGWTRSVLPLLLDARGVWAVQGGSAFYKFNQQISARFDVTF